MKSFTVKYYLSFLLMPLIAIVVATKATPESITPANDGTNTTVNQNGNQINIQGGTRSRDGGNLFHSFDQFNLNSNQTANFHTTPDTQNILGRVTGGSASMINGLIQVIGGNSNLFLMNPAGIVFGPNASLNLPASFTVTTATGIGFNNNNFWFKAMGTNDYSNLVGKPSGYRFKESNPGAIVNEGNLSLNPGENLTLLGGTVFNTGELSTVGGNLTIAAVEEGSTLRISQPGHLLNLEISSKVANQENIANLLTIPLLPKLLTGGEKTHATSMTVNANGDVVLTNSNTLVAQIPGTVIASGNIEGKINVLGDRVAIINPNINANSVNGGGIVLIGSELQKGSFPNPLPGNISANEGDFSSNIGWSEISNNQSLFFDQKYASMIPKIEESGKILFTPEDMKIPNIELNGDTDHVIKQRINAMNMMNNLPRNIVTNLPTLAIVEQNRNNEFSNYFGENLSNQISTKNIRQVLIDIARQTGNNSAIIYVNAYPEELQLVLYTPSGNPILKTIPSANREQLMQVVKQFRFQVTNHAVV